MTRFERLARWLALVLGLSAGCGGGGMGGAPSMGSTGTPVGQATPAELVADLQDHMQRLSALRVVEVYKVVLDAPEAYNCYGLPPCPGSESDPQVAAELARQAPRLARLTEIGEGLADSREVETVAPATLQADLAALGALRIVEVGGLVTAAPASSARCYNLPCAEDLAAADAENGRRAGVVHAWAAEAASEKL